MKKSYDLTGQTFGRLFVKSFYGKSKNNQSLWLCECECGNQKVVLTSVLNSGHTKSCGCLHRDLLRERLTKHNGTNDRLYKVWWDAKRRCEKEYDKKYCFYGGRGIHFCDEWQDYGIFRKWALSHGYDENAPFGECTLDRIDSNGDYCPENCRWVSMEIQHNNCRNTVFVELNGKKYTFYDLSKMCDIPRKVLYGRVYRGWSIEKAMSTPYKKRYE